MPRAFTLYKKIQGIEWSVKIYMENSCLPATNPIKVEVGVILQNYFGRNFMKWPYLKRKVLVPTLPHSGGSKGDVNLSKEVC